MTPVVSETRCVLFAYHEMGYAGLQALLELGASIAALFTHQDAPGEEIWWRSCAELARARGIAVFTPDRLDAQWSGRIATMQPAVIYSFSYRSLLADAVLRLASIGAYNLHGSLLPAYRGRAPVNWVLVNGERETGVTLHHMVARADAGDIVAQGRAAIGDDDTALTLYRKLVPLGAELIRQYHPQIVAGRAPRIAQDLAKGSYYGRRRPEDGRIDWNWDARRIFNLVRAVTHPYPGAFCDAAGHRVMIWKARIAQEDGTRAEAGRIVAMCGDGSIEVAARSGSVFVIRAQLDGGLETPARELLESGPIAGLQKLG